MFGEGMLDQNAVDLGIGVQLLDLGDQLHLRGLFVDLVGTADHSRGLRPLALHPDVGKARRILSGYEDIEPWGDTFLSKGVDPHLKLSSGFTGEFEAIENLCCHTLSLAWATQTVRSGNVGQGEISVEL